MDLDQLKLKTADELNDDEKDYLRTNVDKLDDEDKDAYASFLNPATPDPVTPGSVTPDPVVPDPESPPTFSFNNEDEAKQFVQKAFAEEQDRQKQAAIDAAKTPEEKVWLDDNWKPKTWREGIQIAVQEALATADKKRADETTAQETNRKAFENEWDGLIKANSLPARDTDEGKKVLKSVYDIGVKYGQPSFTKAYELYKILPSDQGGALDVKAVKAERGRSQREAAGQIGGNTPGGAQGGKGAPQNYQQLHNQTMSFLIRNALK